jgi:RNA polymerase sigma factor (sigma-70 family)
MNNQVSHKNDRNEEHTLELLFADLFKKHEYRLHTLVLKLTRSDQYARDIIQEVFLKLWEHRNNIHTIHNIEAWLYRLTENKVIDFLRKAAADSRNFRLNASSSTISTAKKALTTRK